MFAYTGRLVLVVAFSGTFIASWLHYKAAPPRYPPYAEMLRQPEFQGASFMTSNYEGVVWYLTRGSTLMVDTIPPRSEMDTLRFRHFADWENDRKYQNPDYFLCDLTGVFGWRAVDLPHCTPEEPCDCSDVASALEADGHDIIVAEPSFSINRWRKSLP